MIEKPIQMIEKPIIVGTKKLRNRIILAPMCQYMAKNTNPSNWHYQHLGKAMISGFGMIMLESTSISLEGRISKYDLVLSSKSNLKNFKKLIKFLKSLGNIPIGIQLSHSGRKGSSEVPWIKKNKPLSKREGWKTISPSGLKRDKNWPIPKTISSKKIKLIVNQFKNSANCAISAGFDCIELHMAHGYLLHQFLSPISNKRNDEYGGDLKNRCKLPLKIASEIKKKCKKKKIILGVRVTGNDWVKSGFSIEDCVYLVKNLEKIGIDYICVSSGGIYPKTKLKFKRAYNSELSKIIKQNVKIPIRVAGEMQNINVANKVLINKKADLIALGRSYLKDPNIILSSFNKKKINNYIPKPYLRGFRK